jgi:HEAT repeat protein
MEAAKRIILGSPRKYVSELADIAADKKQKKWSRIAAIYALGLMRERFGDKRLGAKILRLILGDSRERAEYRDLAAEALGNLGDRAAVPLLCRCLARTRSAAVKTSCAYALRQIGGRKAEQALEQLMRELPDKSPVRRAIAEWQAPTLIRSGSRVRRRGFRRSGQPSRSRR